MPLADLTQTGNYAVDTALHRARDVIEDWFADMWHTVTPPFYASTDLRYFGAKLAPIDTNLFPAGFNNLDQPARTRAAAAIAPALAAYGCKARNILLIPENHTRNLFYLENVVVLQHILEQAGFAVRIGTLHDEARTVVLPSGAVFHSKPISRVHGRIRLDDFDPCVLVLNNDLSAGVPEQLLDCAQPIVPPVKMGWRSRTKSVHFAHYSAIAEQFADHIGIDSWHIDALSQKCGKINFQTKEGEDCVAENVAWLLERIYKKYKEYGVSETPYVVIKADAGTYGMSITTVRGAHEIYTFNRKQRKKMHSGKEGNTVARVILQEGVHTTERTEQGTAEPVIYMMHDQVVGAFYRMHHEKNGSENLNAPGMTFRAITTVFDDTPRAYAYRVIARLALVASAFERDGAA